MRDLTDEEIRVLGQLDNVWQLPSEVMAGLPYMGVGTFRRALRALMRFELATCRRSDSHGNWEYATTEAGEAWLVKHGIRS